MPKVILVIPGYKLPSGVYTPVRWTDRHVYLERPDGRVVELARSRVRPLLKLVKGSSDE